MIKIKNLSLSYGDLLVIDQFTHDFTPQQITVLFGPSGCGKTSLLNAIVKTVDYKGEIITQDKIAYVFQEDRLLPWLTVYENVAYVLKSFMSGQALKNRVYEYLEMVGLKAYHSHYPKSLSGGMKRRVALARAFAYPCDVLLMDEPFKGLDPSLKETIMSDFKHICLKDKRTILFVTHDYLEAKYLGGEILYLKGLPLEVDHGKNL